MWRRTPRRAGPPNAERAGAFRDVLETRLSSPNSPVIDPIGTVIRTTNFYGECSWNRHNLHAEAEKNHFLSREGEEIGLEMKTGTGHVARQSAHQTHRDFGTRRVAPSQFPAISEFPAISLLHSWSVAFRRPQRLTHVPVDALLFPAQRFAAVTAQPAVALASVLWLPAFLTAGQGQVGHLALLLYCQENRAVLLERARAGPRASAAASSLTFAGFHPGRSLSARRYGARYGGTGLGPRKLGRMMDDVTVTNEPRRGWVSCVCRAAQQPNKSCDGSD